MSNDLPQTGFDPSRRELCPDGACIGVIGPDGLCKECGAPSPNGPPAAAEDDAPVPEAKEAEEAVPETVASAPKTEGDAFDPDNRELCPDGACIGVIGPDGRCKECGRRAE